MDWVEWIAKKKIIDWMDFLKVHNLIMDKIKWIEEVCRSFDVTDYILDWIFEVRSTDTKCECKRCYTQMVLWIRS